MRHISNVFHTFDESMNIEVKKSVISCPKGLGFGQKITEQLFGKTLNIFKSECILIFNNK